jgi:hypothetical protein
MNIVRLAIICPFNSLPVNTFRRYKGEPGHRHRRCRAAPAGPALGVSRALRSILHVGWCALRATLRLTSAVVRPELIGSSTSVAGMVSDGRTASAGVVVR